MGRKKPSHIAFSRKLRREQTEAERALWMKLRNSQIPGVKFRRQHPVGPYIVDYICLDAKVVLELDGGQHNEPVAASRDNERTRWLENKGYVVLRFWNNDVLTNMDGVGELIFEVVSRRLGKDVLNSEVSPSL